MEDILALLSVDLLLQWEVILEDLELSVCVLTMKSAITRQAWCYLIHGSVAVLVVSIDPDNRWGLLIRSKDIWSNSIIDPLLRKDPVLKP